MQNSGAACDLDVYAGLLRYIGNTTLTVCDEPLSGGVSSTNANDAIEFNILEDNSNDLNQPSGVRLEYKGSQSGDYVRMNIYCNQDEELLFSDKYWEHTDPVSNAFYAEMTMNSKYGCQRVQINNYWFFADRERVFFAIIGLVFGFMICFFGRVLLRPTLGISLTGLIVVCTIDVLTSVFYGVTRDDEVYWTAFLIALAVGCLLSYALRKHTKVTSLIVAAYTGEILGTAIANGLYFTWRERAFYWAIIIVCCLAVGCITLINFNKHMIWVTAMLGSFVFMRCLALLLSHYPVIQNLPDLVATGAIDSTLPNYFWYMSLWFCVACLGIGTQLIFLKCMQLSPHGRHPWIKDAIEAVYGPIDDTTYFERRAQVKKMNRMERLL